MSKFENLIYDPKKYFTLAIVGLFAVPLILVGLRGLPSHALTIDSARDCDDNAVIRCGALNFTELETRYSNAGVAAIYSSFGISAADISNARNTAIEGTVTSNDNVWIRRSSGMCPMDKPTSQLEQNNPNLCLVGTNAMTAGRQNIAGSTAMTSGGVSFFQRPPSVSFQSSSLPAFVFMNNGKFAFAIIASCGNPVTATPVVPAQPKPQPKPQPQPQPKPQPQPQPTTPPAAPATTITNNNTNTNTNSNVNNNTVTVQTPPTVMQAVSPQPVPPQQVSTPAPATTQPQAPQASNTQPVVGKTLPNTGPGDVIGLTGLSTIIGTVGHLVYRRRH